MKFQEALAWIVQEARRLIERTRLKTEEGIWLFRPDGRGNYNALWTRDFCYMLEGVPHFLPSDEVVAAYFYLMDRQREDGVIPDRVNPDGEPVYLVMGEAPPTDNAQFAVKIAWEIWRQYGDLSPFERTCEGLERALKALPLSPQGDLIWVDPDSPHSAYGFTDTVAKTGEVLFSSLLLYEAHLKMAEMYEALGEGRAFPHREKAKRIKEALGRLWSGRGYFYAASLDCRQPDVWGSAYAVWIGAVSEERALEISQWLAENSGRFVKWGQVRHLPEPHTWSRTLVDVTPGTYQNGAYWGVATGWVAYALSLTNRPLAEEMIVNLAEFCYAEGTAWECVNEEYRKCPDYAPTLALPAGLAERWKA